MGVYGQPGPEPWQQLVQTADRGPSTAARFIWLVAAVALVAGVVGAFVVVTNPNLLPNLLRFNAPGPAGAPFAAASSPPASASRAPSTPSPSPTHSPSPTVTPAPTPVPEPVARFAKLAADRALSYHLEATATIRQGTDEAVLTMSIDQAGPDIAFVMETDASGRTEKMWVVIKDGMAYAKTPEVSWIGTDDLSDFELPATAIAFSQLKLDQADYLGSETRARRTLHHLVVPSVPSAGADTAAIARSGCRIEDMAMHFWIRDNGIPVTATFDFSCSKRTLLGTSELVISASYEFTKVGKPITIHAPRKFRRR